MKNPLCASGIIVLGLLLGARSPARAAAFVYVTNTWADTVSVIDSSTDEVVATIPVGSSPNSAAVTPDGSRIYVANLLDNTVSIIDATTNTVSSTIYGLTLPRRIAFSPAGDIAYITQSTIPGMVGIIDTATGRLTGNIAVGDIPDGIVVRPDGKRVYAANTYDSSEHNCLFNPDCTLTVDTIDTATNNVTRFVQNVGTLLGSLAINRAGTRVYAGAVEGVAGIDTTMYPDTADAFNLNPISATLAVAVDPSGTPVYAVAPLVKFTGIYMLDADLTQVLGTIETPGSAVALAVTADGSHLYVAIDNDTVAVVDPAAKTVVHSIPVGHYPFDVAIGPNADITPPPTPTPTLTPTVTLTPPPSPTSTPMPCPGDCDGSLSVGVDELVCCVNIALGLATPDLCSACDVDTDGRVTVDDLVAAVNAALNGCKRYRY